jgi:hypothetical protein
MEDVRESVSVPEELSADDFIAGLFAALAKRRVKTLSMREDNFYAGTRASFEKLQFLSGGDNAIRLNFRVILDPLYGDSSVIREALNSAIQRRLVSLDNPEFVDIRMKFGPDEAVELIDRLPGDPSWYDQLADAFQSVQGTVAQPA